MIIEFISVFVVQTLFIFTIDNKYRILHENKLILLILFQGVIASMYVVVIPLIAKGTTTAGIAYILGSVAGTTLSHWWSLKRKTHD